jgi:hypothetical protein
MSKVSGEQAGRSGQPLEPLPLKGWLAGTQTCLQRPPAPRFCLMPHSMPDLHPPAPVPVQAKCCVRALPVRLQPGGAAPGAAAACSVEPLAAPCMEWGCC